MKAPFLEECRYYYYLWGSAIMNTYALNATRFALFDRTGHVDYFVNGGLHYAYEVPCNPASHNSVMQGSRNHTMDYKANVCFYACWNFTSFFVNQRKQLYNPLNTLYKGPQGEFCFGIAFEPNFPRMRQTPFPLSTYRINADKFYVTAPSGRRLFKSPTIADYRRIVAKKMPYLHDNSDLDYVYDYWN